MKTRTKLWALALLPIAVLCAVELDYLNRAQFNCVQKIQNNENLTKYELFGAKLTHTCFWLFGWLYDPNTAHLCFCKQFHMNPFCDFEIVPDSYLLECIERAEKSGDAIRLSWKTYDNPVSVYLNGSYLHYSSAKGTPEYYIIADYSPGTISIAGVTICETVFDYLENIGVLDVFAYYRNSSTGPHIRKYAVKRGSGARI